MYITFYERASSLVAQASFFGRSLFFVAISAGHSSSTFGYPRQCKLHDLSWSDASLLFHRSENDTSCISA